MIHIFLFQSYIEKVQTCVEDAGPLKFTCNNTVEIRDVGTSLGRVKDWYP